MADNEKESISEVAKGFAEDELNQLKSDIGKLRSDLSLLTSKLFRKGISEIEDVTNNLQEVSHKKYDEIEKCIAKHPLTTFFGALGVGMIIGYLTNGKSHKNQ